MRFVLGASAVHSSAQLLLISPCQLPSPELVTALKWTFPSQFVRESPPKYSHRNSRRWYQKRCSTTPALAKKLRPLEIRGNGLRADWLSMGVASRQDSSYPGVQLSLPKTSKLNEGPGEGGFPVLSPVFWRFYEATQCETHDFVSSRHAA